MSCWRAAVAAAALAIAGSAADPPFFVTYTHSLETPGDLGVSFKSAGGTGGSAPYFAGAYLEFEYGVSPWWSTAVYLDGSYTAQSDLRLTGFRWENRFRLLPRGGHCINPALSLELVDVSTADRTLLEVAGREPSPDSPLELESRFILSSQVKGWTLAENLIAARPLRRGPFDFGYAWALSRPIAMGPVEERCRWCAQNFQLGVEMYGGLGNSSTPGWTQTEQYIAATAAWSDGRAATLSFSAGFGLTQQSTCFLLRAGVTHDIDDVRTSVRGLFRGLKRRR